SWITRRPHSWIAGESDLPFPAIRDTETAVSRRIVGSNRVEGLSCQNGRSVAFRDSCHSWTPVLDDELRAGLKRGVWPRYIWHGSEVGIPSLRGHRVHDITSPIVVVLQVRIPL